MRPSTSLAKRFLSIEEIAELLQISTTAVRRIIKTGELPAIRIGKKLTKRPAIRIDMNDLETYIQLAKEWEEEDGGL